MKMPNQRRVDAPAGFERFARLGVMIRTDIKPLLNRLLHLIRGNGIYKVRPNQDHPENYTDFIVAVHDGWKLAQKLIAEKLITNLTEISELEAKKHQFHIQKNSTEKDRIIDEINTINLENRILRRFVDSIVWHILRDEHSTIRRLPVSQHADNLSIKNILDVQDLVDEYNQCALNIAVMADLTTFVHHGDIVLRSKTGVTFIEVKSGAKSSELLETISQSERAACKLAETILMKDFTKSEKQQYSRTKNQVTRAKNLSSTLATNEGHDELTGRKVQIKETKCDIQLYSDELLQCRKNLEENGTCSISIIDSCLYIGMYKDPITAFGGFSLWMKTIECTNPIYNLTDSFHDALSRPLPSLHIPTEFIEEIMSGDIIVVGCLDTAKLFKLAQRRYPSMLFLVNPPRNFLPEAMRVSNKLIAMSASNSEAIFYLGEGLANRIKFDLQKPSSVLKNQYAATEKYYYIPRTNDSSDQN